MYKGYFIGITSLFLLFLVCIGTILNLIDPAMGMIVQNIIFGMTMLLIFVKYIM